MNIKAGINNNAWIIGVLTAFLGGLSIGMFSMNVSRGVIEEQVKNNLVASREAKKYEIEEYFKIIFGQIITFSNDQMVVDALRQFGDAFTEIRAESSKKAAEGAKKNLSRYYANIFQNEYTKRNVQANLTIDRYFSQLPAHSIALQSVYTIPKQEQSANLESNSAALRAYRSIHERYHTRIAEFAKIFGFYDIFLVEAKRGDVVYSVLKEIDFATSLVDGPYSDENIGAVYRNAREAQELDFVGLSDLSPYFPSYEDLAGFIASPVVDGGKTIGILIFQMPIDQINTIMTSGKRWNEIGLGKTGEVYLVGADHKMRSQPRQFVEDKPRFLKALESAGQPNEMVKLIRVKNSAIGLYRSKSKTIDAALAGRSGIESIQDFRGVPMLSAYTPLAIKELSWVIVSEIEEREAYAAINELNYRILVFMLIVLILISLSGCALLWYISQSKSDASSQNSV